MSATAPPPIRQRDIVASEITKILTHPATWIAVVVTFTLNTVLGVLDATDLVRIGVGARTVRLSDLGALMFAPVYAFLIFPVYAAGSEYHGGQLRVTLTATPNRMTLTAGKLLAILAVTVPAAIVVIAPARLVMAGAHGTGLGDIALDLTRWIACYTMMSLIAFGFAGLLRNTIAPLATLALIPLLVATGVFQWPEVIRLLPHEASLSLLGTPGYPITELPPGIAALVLATWALLLSAGHGGAVIRRDT